MNVNGIIFDTPCLEPVETGVWRLRYDWTIVFRGEYYQLPAGTVSDGASIPRALWLICGDPWKLPRAYAAMIHDFLYDGGDPEATRKDADELYRDLQIALGISEYKARLEYRMLRIFGSSHWKNKGKDN